MIGEVLTPPIVVFMRIRLGSTNACKLQSTREVLATYAKFADAEIVGVEVDSGVGEEPNNLELTITGAINRARAAFDDCDFSIGIEGGTIEMPVVHDCVMKFDVCAIYDGEKIVLGFSPGFSLPQDLRRLLVEQGLDLSEAARVAGYTDHQKIGTAGGVVGILTEGRTTRFDFCKQALIMALIHVK